MLRKVSAGVGSVMIALVLLFVVANRPISQLWGYLRAGASTTVKSIEDEIPDVVHDEKTEAELAAARQQLIDRQVQLNLSENQLKDLTAEIETLTTSIGGRKRVLASAYPVLQKALEAGQEQVSFVSTSFSLKDFQHEIDDLLALQERDETTLQIKQDGYQRLAVSVTEGKAALSEMKQRLGEVEQEFAVLKTRRDQARLESEALDLVASATADGPSSAASIGSSVKRLEGQVEKLEARNEARRSNASLDERAGKGKLNQSFNRLEALKKYAEEANSPASTGAEPKSAEAGDGREIQEVAAHISPDELQPKDEK